MSKISIHPKPKFKINNVSPPPPPPPLPLLIHCKPLTTLLFYFIYKSILRFFEIILKLKILINPDVSNKVVYMMSNNIHTPPLHHVLGFITLAFLHPPWTAAQTQSPPPPKGFLLDNKVKVSPTMAIILICLICTFFVMGCVSIYIRQCVERRISGSLTLESDGVAAGRRSRRRLSRGLSTTFIDTFPTFAYSDVKALKIGNGSLECAVCLNEFEDDDTLRLLPTCCHVFHSDCIDVWLCSHVTCPVCRASLVPKPGDTRFFDLLSRDPETEFDDSEFSADVPNQLVFSDRAGDNDLNLEIRSPEVINTVQTPTPGKEEKIRRSYSAGHSLVQPGENSDRFTLRLPEEVRNRLVNSGLSRTNSCVAFQRAGSSRKGYRSSSNGGTSRIRNYFFERFDRVAQPGFSRAGSARSPKVASSVGGGEGSHGTPKTLLKTVRSPLHRLFGRTDSQKEESNVGERSFERLRLDLDSQV